MTPNSLVEKMSDTIDITVIEEVAALKREAIEKTGFDDSIKGTVMILCISWIRFR